MKTLLLALFLVGSSVSMAAPLMEEETEIRIDTIFKSLNSDDTKSYDCVNQEHVSRVLYVVEVKRVIAGTTIMYELYDSRGLEGTCNSLR